MKIATITLNPAFDIHCSVENMQLYKENYASSVIKHAGGKGINISRALSGFGVENTAYCLLGESGGSEFLNSVISDGVDCSPIMTKGRIRENITIHSENKETRISFEGSSIDVGILNHLYFIIKDAYEKGMVVTFTGRLCEGITKQDAIEFLLKVKEMGAKLIVDCNSFNINELLIIKPYLIKPNEQEVSQLLNREIYDMDEALKAAKNLCDSGIENVIISLGAQGFVFVSQEVSYKIRVPKIKPVSTIGAGDSVIAGFLAGMSNNESLIDTLKLAAAFGTAACMTEGTNPPQTEMIMQIKDLIVCEK